MALLSFIGRAMLHPRENDSFRFGATRCATVFWVDLDRAALFLDIGARLRTCGPVGPVCELAVDGASARDVVIATFFVGGQTFDGLATLVGFQHNPPRGKSKATSACFAAVCPALPLTPFAIYAVLVDITVTASAGCDLKEVVMAKVAWLAADGGVLDYTPVTLCNSTHASLGASSPFGPRAHLTILYFAGWSGSLWC